MPHLYVFEEIYIQINIDIILALIFFITLCFQFVSLLSLSQRNIFFSLLSYSSLKNSCEEQKEEQICKSVHLPLLSLAGLFSVLSSILLGEFFEFPKEPLIITVLPEFGQKSHTCLSFDTVMNFLTFCEVLLGDGNAIKISSVSAHIQLLRRKFKKFEC